MPSQKQLKWSQLRVGLTVLFWNALAAALVAAVFLLVRDAGAGPGLSPEELRDKAWEIVEPVLTAARRKAVDRLRRDREQ